MANQKRGVFGLVWFLAGLLALAFFNENIASFLEETNLNRGWTLIQPALQWLAGIMRLFVHPVMTHGYAFIAGAIASIVVLLIAAARQNVPKQAVLISLSNVVDYLTTETAWARERPAITDQMVNFELMDVLAQGRLIAYAREVHYGQYSALKRVNPSYYGGAAIDVNAIRNGGRNQITVRNGFSGDHLEHWQFEKSEVESLWPKPKSPRKKLLGR
ncbi:hypothetical protein [Brevundimonas nasdae]|uniref:Uncharacterized protein n=1 Tax=Brevundimonas nasdae TaxID=172043 RepID=A0ACD4VKH6_9CAUL|nr:hypothetical protein [Brevundimonas nasdae]WOB78472.1 hypothetical protein PZA08_14390 [Brevundimonas nasdae]